LDGLQAWGWAALPGYPSQGRHHCNHEGHPRIGHRRRLRTAGSQGRQASGL